MDKREKQLDKLLKQERDLLEREDDLRLQRKELMTAEEDYFYHEGTVTAFLRDLSLKYKEPHYLFDRLDTEFFHESSKISNSFAEELDDLKRQERKVGNQIEDLAQERVRLNRQEGGADVY